jgi:transcriptional regulator with XRE-family HTH domain
MTQQDFADIFGMSKIWVHSVEKGRHMFPIECMQTLKERFGISYDYLIDGANQPTEGEVDMLRTRVKELTRMNSFLEDHIDLLQRVSPGTK